MSMLMNDWGEPVTPFVLPESERRAILD